MDLFDIAARLDADEKLQLTYRFPVRSADGAVMHETRVGKLLDVAVESQRLYVNHDGQVVWVRLDEAVEVTPETEG